MERPGFLQNTHLMTIDEEKLSYIHLLLDEPIYVVKEQAETQLPIPIASKPEMKQLSSTQQPAEVKPPAAQQMVASKPQAPVPPAKPLPANKSKVMILFFNEQSPYLRRNEEALLQKILAAVHLKIEDVDLVNLNNIRQIDYMDMLKDKVLNQLISFGISLTELNLQIHLLKYQLETVEGIKMLLADSLSFLEHDLDAKKQLWKCLKEMFSK
jgi:DNA polymerase III psi subunit